MNIQPTQTITIDDNIYEVKDQSPEIQQMIAYLDDWRQIEVDEVSSLLRTRAALESMQNNILKQFQTEADAKKEADIAAAAPKEAEIVE